MSNIIEIKVPDIGDFDEVEVIEVLVAVGDSVEPEQSLIALESDKATMEVPSPSSGVVRELKIAIGDKIAEGAVILLLEESSSSASKDEVVGSSAPTAAPPEPPASSAKKKLDPEWDGVERRAFDRSLVKGHIEQDAQPIDPPVVLPGNAHRAHASPSIRRFARELGVDLGQLSGSGRKGRILRDDVTAFVKKAMTGKAAPVAARGAGIPEMPEIDFSKFGDVERKPLSRIRKLSGANLHRSWLVVPHVTQFDQADITELEEFRRAQKQEAEKHNVRLTMLPFLLKAAVTALEEFPEFNSSLSPNGEELILKKYFHIGVAVDTPDGLVVPVVKDVDKKGLFDLAGELGELSSKAREKKLSPKEMQGASFTISSLGGIGGTAFTPIVNAPEVAIMGVSKSSMQPVFENGAFVPRLMLPFSLSYDHRVIDGASAARFTTYLASLLSDIRRVLL